MKLSQITRGVTTALSSIASTITTTSLVLATTLTVAHSANSAETDNQTLVVTASKVEQDINDTLASITVIDRSDIERLQPESVGDLLESLAGIDVVFQGGAGQNTSIFTRGSESDHTLIVVNGVRVGSATSGLKSISSISVSLIERIEIVRGPRAALWGSDAIGAVIQIFTRQLDNGGYILDLRGGSDNYNSGEFSIGFGNDRLNNTFTLSSEVSEGIDAIQSSETDKDGYRRIAAAIYGDYLLSDRLSLNWSAQLEEGNAEFDSFPSSGNETDYKNHLWSIQYTYDADELVTGISVNQSKDDQVTYGKGITRENGSIFETRRNELTLFAEYQFNNEIKFATGFERYEDDVFSTQNFTEKDRTTDAVYVYGAYRSDYWLFDGSIRNDNIKNVEDDNSFNLSAGRRLNENWLVSLSRGKGFKAPTFNDLFSDGAFSGGNRNLESERSYSNEVNIKGNFNHHALVVSVYDNDVDNLISFQPGSDGLFRPVNVNRARITGKELTYQYNNGKFQHKLDLTFLKATNLSELLKQPLIRRVEEKMAYQFSYESDSWRLMTLVQYVGDRPDKDFSQFPLSPIVSIDSYYQVDYGISYFVNQNLNLDFKINDAADQAPTQVLTYNSLGRQIFIGFNYRSL